MRSARALDCRKVLIARVPHLVPSEIGRRRDQKIHGRHTNTPPREAVAQSTRVHTHVPRKAKHLERVETFNHLGCGVIARI